MSGRKLLLLYSWRFVSREWRKFVLPFFSLFITGLVLLLVLLLTTSASELLREEARELEGGDFVFESPLPIDGEALLEVVNLRPEAVAEEYTFTATFEGAGGTAPMSVHAVDVGFPLYGEMILANSTYRPLTPNQAVVAPAALDRLGVSIGDTITFGEASYTVIDTIVSEPTSLFGGFEFFPHVFISLEGYERSGVDPTFLRLEYRYAGRLSGLTETEKDALRALEEENQQLDVDIAGEGRQGFQFGLATVSDFLTIVVLLTTVLAAVNIYSSTLYLVTIERKSLAVLLALGINKRQLITMLGLSLFYVVLLAGGVAIFSAVYGYRYLTELAGDRFYLDLPMVPVYGDVGLAFLVLVGVALTSFIPAARQSLSFTPREVLIGADGLRDERRHKSLVVASLLALMPLIIIAAILLKDVGSGLLVMGGIVVVYCIVALAFVFCVRALYRARDTFSFYIRTVISQKRADGLFGVVAFTSLFVAIAALGSLALLQESVRQYLVGDLASTIPTTYVLDVQPSQRDLLTAEYEELTLFSNLGARIVSIDDVDIETALRDPDSGIDRELGREFNLTARSELLTSETVVAGRWFDGVPGEISVDEEFAKQSNISLGSSIVFLIQGFTVEGVVTSLRSTDSRSGLPFFYFVLSPEDIGQFPSVYFGYANYDAETRRELGRFLAESMPNVSLIETEAIGKVLVELLSLLLVLVFTITLPPLIIATLLIVTLVISSYSIRRRELARLRALGLTKKTAFKLYVSEAVSLTLVAALFGYVMSIAVTWLANEFLLELEQIVIYAPIVLIGIGVIVMAVVILAVFLFLRDTMPLRELLSYE
jgi:putative ABC transport system permease protein